MHFNFSGMITIHVKDHSGAVQAIEIPEDINLNMMEVLRASEYPVAGTCGGLALCASCHVEVLAGIEQLGEPTSVELDMLDTLPSSTSKSRLACQIKVGRQLQNVLFQLKESAEG